MKLILLSLIIILNTNASEPIGYYSKGSIQSSVSIDSYKGHFEKLFRSRGQLFGTTELLDFLVESTNAVKTIFPDVEKFQIGDIAARNGGKIYRHQSHQNGLDIDIVYLRRNRKGQSLSNPEWGEDFTSGGSVSNNFDQQRNWKLFSSLISSNKVGRIFVDLSVKNLYCKQYGQSTDEQVVETLRRLRPAKYHKTHLHLRLKCPKNASRCRKQKDPARGNGCSKLFLESL